MKSAIHLGFWCSRVGLLEVLAFVVSLYQLLRCFIENPWDWWFLWFTFGVLLET